MSARALLAAAALAAGATAHELCIDGSGPLPVPEGAGGYTTCPEYDQSKTCFPPSEEAAQVTDVLNAYQVQDAACEELMRTVTCKNLDGWAAHLFDAEGTGVKLDVPLLCKGLAEEIYPACASVPMTGNPFTGQDGTIESAYPTLAEFMTAFSTGTERNESYCADKLPYEPVVVEDPPTGDAPLICLEQLFNQEGSLPLILEPIPVPGNLMLVGFQAGVLMLYDMDPDADGNRMNKIKDFLDISARVHFQYDERGLLGVAFHKDFAQNGRMFISYSCGDAAYCQHAGGGTTIEELSVLNPTDPATMAVADPNAKNHILLLEQPRSNHNGGQILFRPGSEDPHLYIMLGDGGGGGDPFEHSQDTTTLLGAILRIDIDSTPADGLNYAIPSDNPFVDRDPAEFRHELWAIGLRNPWRSTFDINNPSYFFVADVGQNAWEEVNLATKGGNYGWNVREGAHEYGTRDGKKIADIPLTDPVIEYAHDFNGNKASISGGFVYRGTTEPSLFGKYLFADYIDRLFIAQESPAGSGRFTHTRARYNCSRTSPMPCTKPNVITYGQDNNLDVYIGTYQAVMRIVSLDLCQPVSPSVSPTTAPTASPTTAPSDVAQNTTFSPTTPDVGNGDDDDDDSAGSVFLPTTLLLVAVVVLL